MLLEYVYYCEQLDLIDVIFIKADFFYTDLNGSVGMYKFDYIGDL